MIEYNGDIASRRALALPTCLPRQGGFREGCGLTGNQSGLLHFLVNFDAPDNFLMGGITMACEKETARSRAIRLEEFIERFNKALALRPEVSDEDFMAETEVSDEQYALGVVLPAFSAQEGEPDD